MDRRLPLLVLLLGVALAGCTTGSPRRDVGAEAATASISPHGAGITGCARCHTAAGWTHLRDPLQFDHAADAGFRLTGRHAEVVCRSCHLDLRFDEPDVAAAQCGACHVDVHQARLGIECAACHDTRSFATASRRDPHARTAFPLAGAHRTVACELCHQQEVRGEFTALPTDCVSCHRSDYQRALPDHAAAGFPERCGSCHGVFAWRGARFDHAGAAGYPLEGAHARTPCEACHVPPDFALRFTPTGPRDCVACHRDDYDRAHPNLGFATECLSCHTLDTFRDAQFRQHDATFPIYSGSHSGRWNACSDCHTGGGTQSVSCLNCHAHRRSEMDDKHDGERDYRYETPACLSCHPRGEER